ncbi:MAG: DNA polymerase III subunit beta [Betaproteobacteria bacterium]
MKNIQLDRDALLRPLQAVTGVVERRQTLPILSNVLIESTNGVMTLLATDLEIQVAAPVTGQRSGDDFAVTVSAKKLLDILRALPEGTSIALDQKDSKVQLKAGRSRFSVQTLPAADFPRLAAGQQASAEMSVPQNELRALLGLTQYAMAQQDIRYYLNGMLLVVDKNELTLVATDGHRLALTTRELTDSYVRSEVILPRKAVLELARLLQDTDEEVRITLLANQVKFEFSGLQLITKVVDGKFPDYGRVVPLNYARHFETGRIRLQQALQRAAILSNEKFRGVRWVLTAGSLRIVCTNTEQEEAEEEMEIPYSGDDLDVGFNITYLQDVLNSVDTDSVDCAFGDANSSMLVTLPGRSDFKYVVMPMRI